MLAKLEREAAARGEGCLGRASDDEPVFVLRANDVLAPIVISQWADLALDYGTPPDKVQEARTCALSMIEWQKRTGRGKVPD